VAHLESQEGSLETTEDESSKDCSTTLLGDALPPLPAKEKSSTANAGASEKNPVIEKSQMPKDPVEKQKFESLKDLLGPTVGTWWNDHRTMGMIEESDKRQLTKPLTKEEFSKAREVLGLPKDQSADETRKAIAKTIGIPESAKDEDIRKKLSKQHDYDLGNNSRSPSILERPIETPIIPKLKKYKE
jgi:hypothetical protein